VIHHLLAGDAVADIDTLVVKSYMLTDVSGTLQLQTGRISSRDTRGRIYAGQATASGQVDLSDPAAVSYDLDLTISDARARDLLSGLPGSNRLIRLGPFVSGRLQGQISVQGVLDEAFKPDLGRLTADGTFSLAEAGLSDHPVQLRLADYLSTPSLRSLPIDNWRQPFRLEQGKVHVDGLNIAAGDLELTGAGWQDLGGNLALDLALQLPARLQGTLRDQVSPDVAALIFDESLGPVVLPLAVSGRFDDPVLKLAGDRLTDQIQARAARRLQLERGRVQENLEDQARQALEDLLNIAPDTTAAPADSSKGGLADALKKLLGGRGGG